VQQLFSYLQPASKGGDKKNKAKYKTRRETGKDNQRRKRKFNQMTKSQTKAKIGHLS